MPRLLQPRLLLITVAMLMFLGPAEGSRRRRSSPGLAQTVVLIRHGEKPPIGDDLSPRGWERARCLPGRYAHANLTHLFAYTDHPSNRSVETLTPVSQKLGLPIDTRFGRDEVGALVQHLGTLPATAVALICWEHTVLAQIARGLGVEQPPDYPEAEYDWQWSVSRAQLHQTDEGC